ncbi:TPA: glycosyltransferase family 2 protein [Photobacterium damselae]
MNGNLNNLSFDYYFNRFKNNKITLLTRIRNEEVILQDFLNHVASFCDNIIVFDDCSSDNTYNICRNHEKVCAIIRNRKWDINNRSSLETLHRRSLYQLAKDKFYSDWYFYMDADERIDGDNIREKILSIDAKKYNHIRIPLFDAYLTKNDCDAFTSESVLLNGRNYFGVERRDIIFAWNNNSGAKFILDDAREPSVDSDNHCLLFKCQHYGKAISQEKWDVKCRYYMDNFPYDSYGEKWEKRLGHAIHLESDFNTKLFLWGDELFSNAIKIHPL